MPPRKNAMKANVGSYDCAARFVFGCLVMLAGNHFLSWWGLLGMVPILNAIVSFCPLYAVLGINTTACDEHDHRMGSDSEAERRLSVRDEAARVRVEALRAESR